MDSKTKFNNNNRLKNDIVELLKNPLYMNRLVLYRDSNELAYINDWLHQNDQIETTENLPVSIKDLIEQCKLCNVDEVKKFALGTGSNGVMVILNSPRLVDKAEKMIFRNESGELLRKMITAIKLDINECYITNLIKCEIDSSFLKPSKIVSNCEKIIYKELEVIKPRIVVVFGDIIPLQKIVKESSNVDWFNLEHPITLIKNPDLKRPAWNTLKVVMEKLSEK